MEQFVFSGGVIEKKDDFLMRITFNNEREITLEDMLEITEIRKQLFGENKYVSLIDTTKDFVRFSQEATTHIANDPTISRLRVAEAVLVKNFGQSLGGRLYIKVFKPKSKTMLFYQEDKAIQWLTEQYQESISE